MVGSKWKGTVVAACAWAGLACGQQSSMPSAPKTESTAIVTLQEHGQEPQRCRVLRKWRGTDGLMVFEVQSIGTGQMLTIVQSGTISDQPGSKPGSRVQALSTKIYHWTDSQTPPAGAPLPPPSLIPGMTTLTTPSPTSVTTPIVPKGTNQYLPNLPAAAKPGVVPGTPASLTKDKPAVEPAQPSDWHRSWGKADDHKPSTLPKLDLPHAVPQQADPLKDPQNYSKRPLTASPTSMQKPDDKKTDKAKDKNGKTQDIEAKPRDKGKTPAVPPKTTVPPAQAKPGVAPVTPPAIAPMPATPGVGPVSKSDCGISDACAAAHAKRKGLVAHSTDPIRILQESPTMVEMIRRFTGKSPCPDPFQTAQNGQQTQPQNGQQTQTQNGQQMQPQPNGQIQAKPADKMPTGKPGEKPPESKPTDKKTQSSMMPALTARVLDDKTPPVPGTKSVMAAGDGTHGSMLVVPMPVMTMPPITRKAEAAPPAPPKPQLPPKSEVENAFTNMSDLAPPAQAAPANPESNNAFAVPAGNGQQGQDNAVGNTQRLPLPALPGTMPQGMMPAGRPMPTMPQRTAPNYPMSYPRPAPMMQTPGVVQANVPVPGMVSQRPAVIQASATVPAVDTTQLIGTLQNAMFPSHREWAADGMAQLDCRQHPEVVTALVQGATQDPAATVRVACIRGLCKLNANNATVIQALQSLRNDLTPAVAEEATKTLKCFSSVGR